MSKYFRIQENIYTVYKQLNSRKKQQEFLEKCFIFAWENRELSTQDSAVNIAFLGVKPSLKITETSSNWGGLRENSGRKFNQDDNQDDNQLETKNKSSLLKDISNKEINIKEENKIKEEKNPVGCDNIETATKEFMPLPWDKYSLPWAKYNNPTPLPPTPSVDKRYPPEKSREIKWCGSVIRLNFRDFYAWTDAFPNLDLRKELLSRDEWLEEQSDRIKKNWFISTFNYFDKLNKEK